MAFTKINAAGIGTTETVTVDGLTVINDGSFGGNLTVTGNATISGVLTYEDVTNVDSVGLITARNGVVVGSGITLSKDGDIFATGVTTSTTFSGNFSGGTVSGTTGTFTGDVDIADKIVHTGDTDTAIRFSAANTVSVEAAGVQKLSLSTSEVVFNDTGIDCDLRIEGDSNANLVKVDAGNDRVGVGLAAPQQVFHVYHASDNGLALFESGDANCRIDLKDNSGQASVEAIGDALRFGTSSSNTERVRITSAGDVGIGYDSPTVKLHVREAASGASSYDNRYHIICEDDAEAYLGFYLPDNGYGGIRFNDTTGLEGYIDYYFTTDELHYSSSGSHRFLTAGSERLRINSSGVTMLGSGAIATPKITGPGGLDVSQYGLSICMGGSSGSSGQARANSTQKEARLVIPHYTNAEEPMIAIAAFASSGSNQLNFGGGTSLGNSATEILFHTASDTTTTGSNQKLKIGSDGKITVTSPAIIHSGSSAGSLTLYGGATNHGGKITMYGGNGDATIRFYAQTSTSSPAERLRISGLRVLHNCTSNTGGASSGVYVQEYLGHAYNAIKIRDTANTGTANVLVMIAGSSVSGTITQNGSSASFNTSSDYRLKENEVEISDGISRVKNLKPYKFNWKSDPTKIVDGFFAHEAQAVVPESVTGEKDEVADSDIEGKGVKVGDAIYQVMDHSKLVPLLTAALKEAISKIEVLETEVAALKG